MTHPADDLLSTDDQALRRRLIALARHWLADAGEAEDLVHETWLRTAQRGLPAEVISREAWLVTVLHHLCIDASRRRDRYRAVLGRIAEDDARPAGNDHPERLAEQAQRVEHALRHLVRALPAADVATVLLHEVFDFSHAELGALAGRNEAASRQQLRRTLQRLRRSDPQDRPPDDSDDLLALCRLALVRRDPAGLVAVLRTSTPQAIARSAQAVRRDSGDPARPPAARLIQIGNLLALQIRTADGWVAWLPMGEALTEPA
ncbi:MAG: sigma-70 family RNA polymerase sigma factor [Burkholderiaceae bacterium]